MDINGIRFVTTGSGKAVHVAALYTAKVWDRMGVLTEVVRVRAYCANITTRDGNDLNTPAFHAAKGPATCKRCLAKIEKDHDAALKVQSARAALEVAKDAGLLGPVTRPAALTAVATPAAPTSRRAARRGHRAALRAMQQQAKQARKARKAERLAPTRVASGQPQTVATHLMAYGVPSATATRYAAAFSRGVAADARRTLRLTNPKGKRKGSRVLRVSVKLITLGTFQARLETYRPSGKPAAWLLAA